MGNSLSYQRNPEDNNEQKQDTFVISKDSLIDAIDEIAVKFILKQNMIDMMRFNDKDYYDNMIILTSSILKKELTDIEVGILRERVIGTPESLPMNNNTNNGNKENGNNLSNNNANIGNNVMIASIDDLKNISSKNEKSKQKALTLISKFYVKLMTLYSFIVSVIDPQYVHTTESGETNYFRLKNFNDIDMINNGTVRIHQLFNPMSLIQNRLKILKNKMDENGNNNSDFVKLNPGQSLCNPDELSSSNNDNDDFGLKQLDALYFDVFDTETKQWNMRSDELERKYKRDLKRFYQIFTGKKRLPDNVKTFQDIEQIQFSELASCKSDGFVDGLVLSKSDNIFKKYVAKIKEIEEITEVSKKKLLAILKKMFMVDQDENIIINPKINIQLILKLQQQAIDCVINMYTTCEANFIQAILIFEDVYQQKVKTINSSRNNFLNNQESKLLTNNDAPHNIIPYTQSFTSTSSNPPNPNTSVSQPLSNASEEQIIQNQSYSPQSTFPPPPANMSIPPPTPSAPEQPISQSLPVPTYTPVPTPTAPELSAQPEASPISLTDTPHIAESSTHVDSSMPMPSPSAPELSPISISSYESVLPASSTEQVSPNPTSSLSHLSESNQQSYITRTSPDETRVELNSDIVTSPETNVQTEPAEGDNIPTIVNNGQELKVNSQETQEPSGSIFNSIKNIFSPPKNEEKTDKNNMNNSSQASTIPPNNTYLSEQSQPFNKINISQALNNQSSNFRLNTTNTRNNNENNNTINESQQQSQYNQQSNISQPYPYSLQNPQTYQQTPQVQQNQQMQQLQQNSLLPETPQAMRKSNANDQPDEQLGGNINSLKRDIMNILS